MGKREYLIIVLVGVVGLLLGIVLFSGYNDKGKGIASGSDECEWQNFNQGLYASSSVYRDIGQEMRKGGFVVPLGLDYEEVEFTDFWVLASTEDKENIFLLNDVECGFLGRDIFSINDFSTTCVNVIKEGMNTFNSSKRDVVVHEIYVGMRYRPANCDR